MKGVLFTASAITSAVADELAIVRPARQLPRFGRPRQLSSVQTPWKEWEALFAEILPDATAHARLRPELRPIMDSSYTDAVLEHPVWTHCRGAHSGPHSMVQGADILTLGATGVVGLFACNALRRTSGRTWAIAGRDPRRLRLLQEKFGNTASFAGAWLVEDSGDLNRFVGNARVVIDLSGPKSDFAMAAIEACIQSGTHYIDITAFGTGILFAKRVRDRYDKLAKTAGVSLIFFCGSDAAPDLCAQMLVGHIRERHGLPTRRVDMYNQWNDPVGGTALLEYCGTRTKDLDSELKDPFLLGGVRQGVIRAEDDDDQRIDVNTEFMVSRWPERRSMVQVVRCPCGLFDEVAGYGEGYGDNFTFKAWHTFPNRLEAQRDIIMANYLYCNYDRCVATGKLPKPGQGASEEFRQSYCRRSIFIAEAEGRDPRPSCHLAVGWGPGPFAYREEESAIISLMSAHCLLGAMDRDTAAPGLRDAGLAPGPLRPLRAMVSTGEISGCH